MKAIVQEGYGAPERVLELEEVYRPQSHKEKTYICTHKTRYYNGLTAPLSRGSEVLERKNRLTFFER